MDRAQRPTPAEELRLMFAQAGVSPDQQALEVLSADLTRLRDLVATVHGVAEADELDGVLTFDPAR